MIPRMRALLGAIGLWSLFVLALLYFDPGCAQGPLCMRLVGRSAACQAQAATWNDVLWQYRTLPLLAVVAAGYVAILVVAVLGRSRRRNDARSRA